ncbi:hypothetical protein PFISCL1PPCAC_15463, partial [Pristionchus fissidentatus]
SAIDTISRSHRLLLHTRVPVCTRNLPNGENELAESQLRKKYLCALLAGIEETMGVSTEYIHQACLDSPPSECLDPFYRSISYLNRSAFHRRQRSG